jgi:hypothetical protein
MLKVSDPLKSLKYFNKEELFLYWVSKEQSRFRQQLKRISKKCKPKRGHKVIQDLENLSTKSNYLKNFLIKIYEE